VSASEAVQQLYQDLMRCYEACIKAKAVIKKSRFHLEYELEIYRLAYDIFHHLYTPSKSNIFVVLYPKPREIIAAHIRDRIVHHLIYHYMSPYWERRFSDQSYTCRQAKGLLRVVQDLRSFVRGHRAHSSQPLYYLKVDVAAFFPTIDIGILKSIIFKKLTHPRYRYLVNVILDHRPVDRGQFVLNSPSTQWSKIPRHKSMFYAPMDKGLPIGNLTSQFFANIYLNELDQYITHHLQGSYIYWQRYVDDVLFLATDANALKLLPTKIDDFLSARLALRLNSSKTIIQPLARGIDHLGFWLKPDHLLVRQKNVKAFYEKLNAGEARGPRQLHATMNSYIGMFCHEFRLPFTKLEITELCPGFQLFDHLF
jgi:hypothetical protein